jgi:predicted Fe-Mo cluster-binding NifX family protein
LIEGESKMLAIPLDEKDSTTISKLFGNAPYFALADAHKVSVVENKECGNGPKSAQFLKESGATATIYYHMGEGVYNAFVKNGIDVYSSGHNQYPISQVYGMLGSDSLIKLTDSNYKELLDPGNGGECKCGCENG